MGRIDGAVERGLLSRFQLKNLHGVYHINGTETRQYCEGHACEGLKLQTKQVRGRAALAPPMLAPPLLTPCLPGLCLLARLAG